MYALLLHLAALLLAVAIDRSDHDEDSWQTDHVQGTGGAAKTKVLGKNITERALDDYKCDFGLIASLSTSSHPSK